MTRRVPLAPHTTLHALNHSLACPLLSQPISQPISSCTIYSKATDRRAILRLSFPPLALSHALLPLSLSSMCVTSNGDDDDDNNSNNNTLRVVASMIQKGMHDGGALYYCKPYS